VVFGPRRTISSLRRGGGETRRLRPAGSPMNNSGVHNTRSLFILTINIPSCCQLSTYGRRPCIPLASTKTFAVAPLLVVSILSIFWPSSVCGPLQRPPRTAKAPLTRPNPNLTVRNDGPRTITAVVEYQVPERWGHVPLFISRVPRYNKNPS